MDEGEIVSKLCRKELRKLKLMEFLAAKGKLKPANLKPYLRDEVPVKKAAVATTKTDPARGKENQAPKVLMKNEDRKIPFSKATSHNTVNGVNRPKRAGTLPAFPVAMQSIVPKGPTQPVTINKKPATTRALKPNIGANNQPRKPPNTAVALSSRPGSGKPLLNARASQSNSRPSSAAHASMPQPPTYTDCVRMSLGPKTKTGLMPAALHPKNAPLHTTTTFPAATVATSTTSVVHRARSMQTVVAQKSAVDRGKTRPGTSLNRPVQKSTAAVTVNTRVKVSAQSKTDSKPLAGRPRQLSCQSRAPATLKPTLVPSRPTFATVKSGEGKRVATTTKPVVQPAKTAAQQVSMVKGPGNARPGNAKPGNARPWKASIRASSGAATQWQATALNRAVHAAVSELGQTDEVRRGIGVKKGGDSTKVPPSKAGNKGTGMVSMPMTVPRPSKHISQVGFATDLKTPRAQSRIQPQTKEKKLTVAQEERMRKLQEWREAKGISYKRPPMPVKPRARSSAAMLLQPYWTSMEEEDEAHSLMCAVDTSLADCITLLQEGAPPEQVMEILSRLPAVAQKFAKYWICQVRLMEHQGKLEVLPMFEEAVRVVLEPVDELRTVVFEILKKKNESQGHSSVCGQTEREESPAEGDQSHADTGEPMATPKPVKAFICGENGDSSVIKYKITGTPGGFRSQQKEQVRVDGQEVRFFTPVRRSVRIERSSLRYPASLQDHDLCVTSYNHLMAEEEESGRDGGGERGDASPTGQGTPMYVYRENEALEERVKVQLVYEDA